RFSRDWSSVVCSSGLDTMKGSSRRMKNKVGTQTGAFLKMKQENMYVYQWLCGVCYVPIIAPFQTLPRSIEINSKPVYCGFWPLEIGRAPSRYRSDNAC